MADTKDRRSEGKACDSNEYVRYKKLEASGLCVNCGKQPVKNRKYCYECSDRTGTSTRAWAVRKSMAKHKLDPNVDVNRLNEMVRLAQTKVDNSFSPGELAKAEDELQFFHNLRHFFTDNMRLTCKN